MGVSMTFAWYAMPCTMWSASKNLSGNNRLEKETLIGVDLQIPQKYKNQYQSMYHSWWGSDGVPQTACMPWRQLCSATKCCHAVYHVMESLLRVGAQYHHCRVAVWLHRVGTTQLLGGEGTLKIVILLWGIVYSSCINQEYINKCLKTFVLWVKISQYYDVYLFCCIFTSRQFLSLFCTIKWIYYK